MKQKTGKTLAEYLDEYYAQTFIGLTDRMAQLARQYLTAFEMFLGSKKLDPTHYAKWVQECHNRWSPGTAKLALSHTDRFLRWLENMDYIVKSPHRVIKKPVVALGTPRPAFTPAEYEALKIGSIGTELHWLVVLGWATGMRLSDCCLLTWERVDLNNLIICTPQLKTKRHGKLQTVPFEIGSDVYHALTLKAALPPSTHWPNNPANKVYYVDPELARQFKRQYSGNNQGLQRKFRALCDRVGIPSTKSFHSFRVSMCSVLANSGINMAVGMAITGHQNPQNFIRYVRVQTSALRAALHQARQTGAIPHPTGQ
jgi:integrase